MKHKSTFRFLMTLFCFCSILFLASLHPRADIYREIMVGESSVITNNDFTSAGSYTKIWEVSNSSVLKIDPNADDRHCTIIGLKPGTARVSCETISYRQWTDIHGNPYVSSPISSSSGTDNRRIVYYDIEVKSSTRYTLKFSGNGGSVSKSKIIESKGSDIGTLPTAKRKGYLFSGWYTSKKGGRKISSSTKCTASRTYYAHWKKITVGRTSAKKLSPGYKRLQAEARKVSRADGYQISYSLKSNMKNARTAVSAKPSFQLRNLKAGKVYYVRIRAYRLDSAGKKVYGSWSPKKKVRIALAEMSVSKSTLVAMQNFRLKLNGAKSGVRWSSSNSAVAAVSQSGVVTGKQAGQSTITAVYRGKRYRSTITVQAPRLNHSSLTLSDGASAVLSVSGTTLPITWTSSNPSSVTVSGNGQLTAAAPGTASVSAVVNGVSHTCRVTVAQPAMNVGSASLYRGDTLQLKVENTARWTESFKSSNESVAKVSSSGLVTTVGNGSAIITAVVNGKYYTCQVTVQERILSAYASYTNTLFSTGRYRYDTKNQGKYTIQLLNCQTGVSANQYALRNTSNPIPEAGQEYILLKFRLACLEAGQYGSPNSFYENLFCTSEFIGGSNYYYTPFHDASGEALSVKRRGLPAPGEENPSKISAGETITYTVLLLVDSFDGPLTYSFATEGGNNEVWFTTQR